MSSQPFLVELSSTPFYLLMTFAGLLILFDVVLVRLLKLSNESWKKVDYIWLGVAAVGLLAASAQAERLLANRYIGSAERYVASAYSHLLERLEMGTAGSVCRPFVRSEYSPSNFDEMVKEFESLCAAYRELLIKLPTQIPKDGIRLADLGFKMPIVQENILGSYIDLLRESVRRYEEALDEYNQLKARAAEGQWETAFAVMGPLLIAIALALRLTKVTGELRNHKPV